MASQQQPSHDSAQLTGGWFAGSHSQGMGNAVPYGAALCDWLLFGGGERTVLAPSALQQQRASTNRKTFAEAAPPSRWVVLSAAVIAECAGCGIGYSFGLYSPLLKSHFGLTQTQLATINTTSMIVSVPPFCFFFAWIYGVCPHELHASAAWNLVRLN